MKIWVVSRIYKASIIYLIVLFVEDYRLSRNLSLLLYLMFLRISLSNIKIFSHCESSQPCIISWPIMHHSTKSEVNHTLIWLIF